jgi:hypothetical protein
LVGSVGEADGLWDCDVEEGIDEELEKEGDGVAGGAVMLAAK